MARLFARAALKAVAAAAGLIAAACSEDAVAIHLESTGGEPAWVRVSGLTGPELERLRTAVWREEGWRALLLVTAADGGDVPLPGRYIASREALEFHPRTPLEPGRSYRVRFDPSRLPVPRSAAVILAMVHAPPRPEPPRALVTSVSPSGDVWPANLLRFYVHFSTPMSRTEGRPLVQLLDGQGQVVTGAITPMAIEFWNPERTRYTGFLSSGTEHGDEAGHLAVPVLEPGRQYTLAIDVGWRNARGRPLEQGYRHSFRAGAPIREPVSLTGWKISAPTAGTSDPLVVGFSHALDVGLLERSVTVAPVGKPPLEGAVEINPAGTEWRFAPAAAWLHGAYEMLVLSTLEDPSGNRIGRAVHTLTLPADEEPSAPEPFKIPFSVR